MNSLIPINNISVNFEVVGEEVFATSLQIAQVFGKSHKNVLRTIDNLPQDNFFNTNFKINKRTDLFGAVTRSEKYYNLTRDGFSLLVMGFTGQKAYQWKIEFIKAFNTMEAMIKQNGTKSDKFGEVLTRLGEKSREADLFKRKYYESIERENSLLREKLNVFEKIITKSELIKKSSRLTQNERDKILSLYKNWLGCAQISRHIGRSECRRKNDDKIRNKSSKFRQ
jgi:phage regulatory protein, rha family